jgi:ribonuclease HII
MSFYFLCFIFIFMCDVFNNDIFDNKLVSGIDEAGRGCVLGPMVISICTIYKKDDLFFKQIGVKDSKLLSAKKREELFKIIIEKSKEYKIIVILAQELNILMNEFSLNEIEIQKFAILINSIKNIPSNFIIDAPEKNTNSFKLKLYKYICNNKLKNKIIAENKADLNYVVVGCASILSKVTRDRLLKEDIKCNISGYPSDYKTIAYIKEYFLKYKKLPDCTRTKWKTVDNILKELYQKKISWFK